MTNAEKFKEVFGFELNTKAFEHNFCIVKSITKTCIEHNECYTCPYESWAESEYNEPCCDRADVGRVDNE